MNEYRERLLQLVDGEDPLTVLGDTPRILVDLVGEIGDDRLAQPWAPGKWTAREILGHLADVEQATAFRIRNIVHSPPGHVIQPFDQDLWAQPYAHLPTRAAVRALVGARTWNIAYIRSLSKEDLARVGLHPERGEESVETIIRMQAGHDRNHLAQLRAIATAVRPERDYDLE